MAELHKPRHVVDTHQHLWVLSERRYDWLTPEAGLLYRDFRPEDVAEDVIAAGVTATVLVQAADTYDDTFYMMSVAGKNPSIKGVVGWLPLDRPEESASAVELFSTTKIVKGFRNLTHSYGDSRWLIRSEVSETLALLSQRGFSLDVVSGNSEQTVTITELSQTHSKLKIVVDHMGKPPIAESGWQPWADQITALAEMPNVFCKISGLNTISNKDWSFGDWQQYVDHTVEKFGSERVMLGSDWPVSLLNGDFSRVWRAQCRVIAGFSPEEQNNIYFKSADRFYGLNLESEAAPSGKDN